MRQDRQKCRNRPFYLRFLEIAVWVTAAAVVVFLSAQTVVFRLGLSRVISFVLEKQLNAPVRISPVEGWLPFSFSLENITIGEEEKPWLALEGLEMSWSPRRLLEGRLQIDRFHLRSLRYRPPPSGSPKEKGGDRRIVPSFLYRVGITHFLCWRLILGGEEVEDEVEIRLEGSLLPSARMDRLGLTLAAEITESSPGRVAPAALFAQAELSRLAGGEYTVFFRSAIYKFGVFSPALEGLLAPVALIELRGRIGPASRLNFEEVTLSSPGFRFLASGEADLDRETLDFFGRFDLDDLEAFGVSGSAQARFELSGSPSLPRLDLRLSVPEAAVAGVKLREIIARLEAELAPEEFTASLEADFSYAALPFRLEADSSLRDGVLTVWPITMTAPSLRLDGWLRVAADEPLLTGGLKASSTDLSFLEKVTGLLSWGGVANINADIQSCSEGGKLILALSGDDLETPWFGVENLQGNAEIIEPFSAPQGRLDIDLNGVSAPLVQLESGKISVRGSPAAFSFRVDLEGCCEDDFSLKISGAHSLKEEGSWLLLESLGGNWGDWEAHLLSPSGFRLTPGLIEFEDFILAWDGGRLEIVGRLSEEDSDFLLGIESLPLSLPFMFPGLDRGSEMNGKLELSGRVDSPLGKIGLSFSGIKSVLADTAVRPGISLDLGGRLGAGRLAGSVLMEGLATAPLSAAFDLPLEFSLDPFRLKFDLLKQARGKLDGEVDLSFLDGLVDLDFLGLEGLVKAALELSGTIQSPDIDGFIQFREGVYENPDLGLVFRGIEAILTFLGSRVSLEAEADDGGDGKLVVRGEMSLRPDEGYPFDSHLRFSDFRLPRHDLITADSSADIAWSGNRFRSLLSGSYLVNSAEVRIPDRLPPHITDIEVIEIGLPRPAPVVVRRAPFHEIELDLKLEVPHRFFLRGQGLDSEWSGELRVQGTTFAPLIVGGFEVIRGRLVFFGQRLILAAGLVSFDGRWPLSPVLDIVAETVSAGITTRLAVAGEANSLVLSISSDPPLPEDAILSRMLFGREVSRISPLQAITFARALHSIATGQTAFDFISRGRRLLGVDQLELRDREEAPGSTAVSVGKYVGDRIFVELERGIADDFGRVTFKIELTPIITLETQTSSETGAGVGLSWRWDY